MHLPAVVPRHTIFIASRGLTDLTILMDLKILQDRDTTGSNDTDDSEDTTESEDTTRYNLPLSDRPNRV